MANQVFQSILRTLTNNPGCSPDGLTHVLPREDLLTERHPRYTVLNYLKPLIDWGLVEAYEENAGSLTLVEKLDPVYVTDVAQLRFYISERTVAMEKQLGVSLIQQVSPIFGEPRKSKRWTDLFVLMPFEPNLKPIFDDHIKKVALELGLSCSRADDFFSSGSIISDVWSAIYHAKIIVADCTHRNPNVFYEIGVAHTLGKKTVLLSQSIEDIPFDLRHLRVIVYTYTPRGIAQFEESLKATIEETLED